ncbi:ATP-binding protein [Streptomyces doebereineriae]|uniref:Histidine kinase/HSP90-like ATPase domain-containing protein n=1 Tax=Streptomyces doebereineriae TaxID=3075528 RepID=A0ABU2VG09_9ACTN|nr:hypothetical protein [Streptomyces sp. DSM 41640]MDT0484521.1 hypothetical protein [Streptomyces sp. DSM 41640]
MSQSTASHTFLEVVSPNEELRFMWEDWMMAEQFIGPNTRLRIRPRLTAARWSGNIDAAARVGAMLTDNAVRHGRPLYGNRVWLRLMCLKKTDDLIVEVDDARPDFPRFDEAASTPVEGGKPTGLCWVQHYRGRLAWQVKRDTEGQVIGKTVQVVLPERWSVDAAD